MKFKTFIKSTSNVSNNYGDKPKVKYFEDEFHLATHVATYKVRLQLKLDDCPVLEIDNRNLALEKAEYDNVNAGNLAKDQLYNAKFSSESYNYGFGDSGSSTTVTLTPLTTSYDPDSIVQTPTIGRDTVYLGKDGNVYKIGAEVPLEKQRKEFSDIKPWWEEARKTAASNATNEIYQAKSSFGEFEAEYIRRKQELAEFEALKAQRRNDIDAMEIPRPGH